MNLIKVGADRHRVQHLFITHHHTDHFADFLPFFFDAVFHAKFVAPRPGLTIYGPRGTRRLFGTLVKVVPGFSTAPFPIAITEPGDRTIRIGRTRVTAGTVVHSPRLHCQGYRVEHDGAVFTYSGDSEYCAGLVKTAPSCSTRRSEEHTSELQSRPHLVCRLLLEKKKKTK